MMLLRAAAVATVLLLLPDSHGDRMDDLYKKGLAAHRESDHVTALMNLNAYYQAEHDHLSESGRAQLMAAINDNEAQVRHAVKLRSDIRKLGPIQHVVVRPAGTGVLKDDVGQGREVRVPFPSQTRPSRAFTGKLPDEPGALRQN